MRSGKHSKSVSYAAMSVAQAKLPFKDKRHRVRRAILLKEQKGACIRCKKKKWLGLPIALEYHHKDGNHSNNKKNNSCLICPNCHAQTRNYRGKNISKESRNKVSDTKLVNALRDTCSIHRALIAVKLVPKGGNYVRAKRLVKEYGIIFRISERSLQAKIRRKEKLSKQEEKLHLKLARPPKLCLVCKDRISYNRKFCSQECVRKRIKKASPKPTKIVLAKDIAAGIPFTRLGTKYGVSDNAVRKWARKYKII